MWRKIAQSVSKYLFFSARGQEVNSSLTSLKDKYPRYFEAQSNLKNAISELSDGMPSVPIAPKFEMSTIMNKSNSLDSMTIQEIEALANAYYEGNGVPNDLAKAASLWKEASNRGSLAGSYSYAVCKRDGVGVEKNLEESFNLLKDLANNNHFSLAHVSINISHILAIILSVHFKVCRRCYVLYRGRSNKK